MSSSTVKCEKLVDAELAPATSDFEFQLHRAALEWSLADPIVIRGPEDIKSESVWRDKVKPFDHQVRNLMTFCRRLPVTLLADDVGLGKTISAGLILSELMVRRRVSRTLVIAPKILLPQWKEELESKFGIEAEEIAGGQIVGAFKRQTPVVITTYATISNYIDRVRPGTFDMLVLDEAHKVRNLHGTNTPPKMATRLHGALNKRLFKYVLMLTATPIQNRLWDLYSLVDCLATAKGHRNPLGGPQEFRSRFIADASKGARQLVRGRESEFKGILRQYLAKTRRLDAKLEFPKREVQLFRQEPTSDETELTAMIADRFEGLNGLLQSSISRALFSSPQALASQLENSRSLPWNWDDVIKRARQIANTDPETAKLKALRSIIEEMMRKDPKSWRLVVFTIRKDTQAAIGRMLASSGIRHGFITGGQANANKETIEQFRADPPGIHVVVSTDAGAEGVNLQSANTVVNYDLPWNPMIVEQRIGRVQRLGSKFAHVVVINLVVQDSVEEQVVVRLMAKLQTVAHTVGDIEAILESSAGNKDEVKTFESQILDLVNKSMRGQDVTRAAKLAEKSIDDAQRRLEMSREEIDATLGNLGSLHRTGPSAPKLQAVEPSLDYKQFALQALRTEGVRLEDNRDGTWAAYRQNKRSELLMFDQAAWKERTRNDLAPGPEPVLYLPGKPAFERLVQRWVNRAGHRVYDLVSDTDYAAGETAQAWLSEIEGAKLSGINRRTARRCFEGVVICKATAENGVDSYEKLIDVACRLEGQPKIELREISEDTPQLPATRLGEITPELAHHVKKRVETDSDVKEFCRFYEERLAEESKRSKGNSRALKRAETDYLPLVQGRSVAMQGAVFSEDEIDVTFTIDGHGPYQSTIRAVTVLGDITSPPEMGTCHETNRRVPASCLARCEFSNKDVMSHLLAQSQHSGRRAVSRYMQRCAETDQHLLQDEVADCCVTGKRVGKHLLASSDVSGKSALKSKLVTCSFTGDRLLPDESEVSEVSRKVGRKDGFTASAVSDLRGHESEFIKCQVTDVWILERESAASDVSGVRVRKDLLVASDRAPHRRGLEGELATCEVSGLRLLIDELGTCGVTGKRVDRDRLVKSDVSDMFALDDQLKTCAITGKRALPHQLVRSEETGEDVLPLCELTGERVPADTLHRCEHSHQIIQEDRMVQSVVSGKWINRDLASYSADSGEPMLRSEAVFCTWDGVWLLPGDSRVCRLSGLPFRKKYIIATGEFHGIRKALDGDCVLHDARHMSQRLQPKFKRYVGKISYMWVTPVGPSGVAILVVEGRKAMGRLIGSPPFRAAVMVHISQEIKFAGGIALGRRYQSGWRETSK